MKIPTILTLIAWFALPVAVAGGPYTLGEYGFDSGGELELSSPEYSMTLTGVGGEATPDELGSEEYTLAVGVVGANRPPGEVLGLRFTGTDTLQWDVEASAGTYDLYRAPMADLPGLGYGACFQPDLEIAQASGLGAPAPSGGYFYLVTVTNRLGEEGTKGSDSTGAARPNAAACP